MTIHTQPHVQPTYQIPTNNYQNYWLFLFDFVDGIEYDYYKIKCMCYVNNQCLKHNTDPSRYYWNLLI